MIDLTLLRNESERVIALLKKKEPSFDAQALFDLDQEVKKIRQEVINWKTDLSTEFFRYLGKQLSDLTSYLAW